MSIRLQLKTKQLSELAKEYGVKAKPNLRRIIPGDTSRRRIDFGKELAEAISKFSALQTTLVELSDLTEKMQEDCQQLRSKIVSIESGEAYIIDPVTQKYQQKACKIFQEAEPELESALKGVRKAIRSVRYKAESDDPSNSPDIIRSHGTAPEVRAAPNPSSKPAKSERGRKEPQRSRSKDKYHAEHSCKKSSEPRERNRSTSVDKYKSRQHSDKKSKHSKSKQDKPTDQTTDNAATAYAPERNGVPPQVLDLQRQERPGEGASPRSPPPPYQTLPPPGSNAYPQPPLGLYPQIETSSKDAQVFLR